MPSLFACRTISVLPDFPNGTNDKVPRLRKVPDHIGTLPQYEKRPGNVPGRSISLPVSYPFGVIVISTRRF